MQKYIIIIVVLALLGCSNEADTKIEMERINKILEDSKYTFEDVNGCNCIVQGPSPFDGVGKTQWNFDLKETTQIIDTFERYVYIQYENHNYVNVQVLEWFIDFNSKEKNYRSLFNHVPIGLESQLKAQKLVKNLKSAAKKCGAKIK